MVTAGPRERSRGTPACWGRVPQIPLPGRPRPRPVTVMDAIACAGGQHVPRGLSPSALLKTGIQGARHREAPNLPVCCSTCFALPRLQPSLEEEVGPFLLSLPEWDDLSMSHSRHDRDPVSLETVPNEQLHGSAHL